MPHQMLATPPNTPTESSEPVSTSTIYEETGAAASVLSEQLEISTIMRPSQPPSGVAHPAHPAQGALALSQEQQDFSQQEINNAVSYLDQIKLQFVDQPDKYNTFLHILMDYKSQVIDFPSVTSRVSETLARHPNLIQGFNIYLPPIYQIECGSSNDPDTICATGHPVARNALTLTRTEQSAGFDGVTPQQPDAAQATAVAAKDAKSFDFSTMMDPWITSLPLPQMLAIIIQPPELTRQKIELFPPIVVRLLQPEDMSNVYAIATLLSNGIDVTDQLGGELIQSPIDGTFRFSRLTIHEQGVYCVRISLYRMDLYSFSKGVAQVGCVDSSDIIVAPRPDFMAIRLSISDVTTAQDTQWVRQQLFYQTVDANTCKDDHTGYFPNLKIHAGSSVITMGLIEYSKFMVLIPVSDFKLETANLDHGLYNLGDGLFRDEDGVWYDDGEVEWAECLDESIWLGEDGEMYRKRTNGVFTDLFVGLERRVAIVDNGVICIAHNVLINCETEEFKR